MNTSLQAVANSRGRRCAGKAALCVEPELLRSRDNDRRRCFRHPYPPSTRGVRHAAPCLRQDRFHFHRPRNAAPADHGRRADSGRRARRCTQGTCGGQGRRPGAARGARCEARVDLLRVRRRLRCARRDPRCARRRQGCRRRCGRGRTGRPRHGQRLRPDGHDGARCDRRRRGRQLDREEDAPRHGVDHHRRVQGRHGPQLRARLEPEVEPGDIVVIAGRASGANGWER